MGPNFSTWGLGFGGLGVTASLPLTILIKKRVIIGWCPCAVVVIFRDGGRIRDTGLEFHANVMRWREGPRGP